MPVSSVQKMQILRVALYGLGTRFSAPAVVHVLVDVAAEVPGQAVFHKKCPRFIEKIPNKPRAFMALKKKVYGVNDGSSKAEKPLRRNQKLATSLDFS